MPLTVGQNSYVDVATADTYFTYMIHATVWRESADTTTKEQALITATAFLDRQDWEGTRYQPVATQPLEWPRSGLQDKDGNDLDETAVPQQILDATCELGLALINDPSLLDSTGTGSGNIKRLKAGSAEIEYIRSEKGTRFPTIVQELIGLWLTAGSGGALALAGPFVSGADNESSASDTFDLTRGY